MNLFDSENVSRNFIKILFFKDSSRFGGAEIIDGNLNLEGFSGLVKLLIDTLMCVLIIFVYFPICNVGFLNIFITVFF